MRQHKRGRWSSPMDTASPPVRRQLAALFSRRFDFTEAQQAGWQLPQTDSMFPKDNWQVPELQEMKRQLNAVKSRLSDKEIGAWHEHTCNTNRAGLVVSTVRRRIKPEMATQAWCKLYELLSLHAVLPAGCESESDQQQPLSTLHLCEAPGAFVTALNHYCVSRGVQQWDWRATTLNPYHEGNPLSRMISDDRFILHTLQRWHFGADDTGDLMTAENMHHLLRHVKEVNLVTADGSVDCQREPAEQESLVSPLHHCEVLCALRALKPGGALLLKMFTFFEASTCCLMYLLCCRFKQVSVVKPSCSKAGNSEVYVVCRELTASEPSGAHVTRWWQCWSDGAAAIGPRSLFARQDVPDTFVQQLTECASFFKSQQEAEIERNLALWRCDDSATWAEVAAVRQAAPVEFIRRCRLASIERELRLTHPPNTHLYTSFQLENKSGCGTYEERTGAPAAAAQLSAAADRLASLPAATAEPTVAWRPQLVSDFRHAASRTLGLRPTSLQACKFCSLQLLKLLRSVAAVLDADMLKCGITEAQTVASPGGERVQLRLPGRSLPWMCDAGTMKDLRNAAAALSRGGTLDIHGLFLFHRLNISLVHVLAPACGAISLSVASADSRPTPVVTLHAVADPAALVSLLEDVISVSSPDTLSLLPVVELCEVGSADTLVQYNDRLLRSVAEDLVQRYREPVAESAVAHLPLMTEHQPDQDVHPENGASDNHQANGDQISLGREVENVPGKMLGLDLSHVDEEADALTLCSQSKVIEA